MGKTPRILYLDSCRGIFMLLGIPFHAAIIYLPDESWGQAADVYSALAAWAYSVIHSFRMPAFFIIAGFFSAMMLSRRPRREWLSSRFLRLGVPLLSGMVIIIPLQLFLIKLGLNISAQKPIDLGLILSQTLSSDRLFDPSHLWFLAALLEMSILLAFLWPRLFAGKQLQSSRLYAVLSRPGGVALLMVMMLVIWRIGIRIVDISLKGDLWPVVDLFQPIGVLKNLPFFMLGVIYFCDRGLYERFLTIRPLDAVAAIGSVLIYGLVWQTDTTVARLLEHVAMAVSSVYMSALMIALLRRLFDRPSPRVSRLVEIALPVYIFHQPMVFLFGTMFMLVDFNGTLKYLALTCVVTIASVLLARLAMSSRLLSFMFSGSLPRGGGLASSA